jgi:antirestriction protein ArdC
MKDIYVSVTNSIITALEQGVPPWVCPWQGGDAMPSNLVTGKPYRGINVLMLYVAAMSGNHADDRWLTFRQANEIGARIRKGEHGTQIVFYRVREIKEATGDVAETDMAERQGIPMLKIYTVFNASQLEVVPERYAPRPVLAWQPIEEAEHVLNKTGAVIRHGGSRAFYRPSDDIIQLPPQASFAKPEDYYATALHELCHWVGHPSRLNRVLGGRKNIEAYAYEELVAEIGAAFLCAHCGLSARLEHASYISSWLDALRRDKRLIFVAAGAAQKAVDFVLGAEAVVCNRCVHPSRVALIDGDSLRSIQN